MAVAAVPLYMSQAVGESFATAPPGHQFNLYLKVWKDDFKLDKTGKDQALASLKSPLSGLARGMLGALVARQAVVLEAVPDSHRLTMHAICTSPFITGLGNEHALENGFAFLNPYGLPYLPASGVKGVLRRAAEHLRDGGFSGSGNEAWTDEAIQNLFGTEDEDVNGDVDRRRGALCFQDVVPRLAGDRLQVEVATPHQHEYLQGNESPHDSGSPKPIFFLSVPPESRFEFHITANPALLGESLKADERWKSLLQSAFMLAFDWLGFGAKTAVGYGAMVLDEKAQSEAADRREETDRRRILDMEKQAREVELAQMSPVDRLVAEAIQGKQPGQSDDSAVLNAIKVAALTGDELIAAAQRLKVLMQQGKSWKETTAAKKPEKDKEHQRTLDVMRWLSGQ